MSEEENQKLKEMIQSLGAGRTVDAQTFEDLGRKQREIAEAEAALKDMQKTFQEKLEEVPSAACGRCSGVVELWSCGDGWTSEVGPCYFVFVQPNVCSAEVGYREADPAESLFSLHGLEDADHLEQMQELQKAGRCRPPCRMVLSCFTSNQEQVLKAKEEEVEELRRELALLRNPGRAMQKYPRPILSLCSGAHKVMLTCRAIPTEIHERIQSYTLHQLAREICHLALRGDQVNEMLYAGHSKVSLAIDNTFEEALAQLSAVEAMLTSCAPRSDSPKILGTTDIDRYPQISTDIHRYPQIMSETSIVTLLGRTEEVRCSTDMLLVNPNRGFGWHQDNQNGPIEFKDAIRWWVAMDACGQDGFGAPEYLLGSHRNESVSSDAVFVNLEDGDLDTFPRKTRYTPEPGDLIIWDSRTIHRIVAPPGQKWDHGTQRRAIGGTMAKAGAVYINKGGASGISDLAGHTQQNGELLGGPYFPRIYPNRVKEEEAGVATLRGIM
eukprot:s370_g41.t1